MAANRNRGDAAVRVGGVALGAPAGQPMGPAPFHIADQDLLRRVLAATTGLPLPQCRALADAGASAQAVWEQALKAIEEVAAALDGLKDD
jgi:hypothetical protein